MSKTDENLISLAAQATAKRPAFLGWILSQYQEVEGLDDAALARALQIMPSIIPSLCLCLRPRPAQFVQDVEQIANAFGCDADALISIVRHVEFVDASRGVSPATDTGRLLAARSRPKRRGRGKGGRKL